MTLNAKTIKPRLRQIFKRKDDADLIFGVLNEMTGGDGSAVIFGNGITVTAGGLGITAGGLTVTAGGATITGNSTITGTLGGLTGLTVASGGASIEGSLTLADGGTVTQITSITTGVTLNTNSGQITTVSSTLAAAGEATFTVTNSNVAATDTVLVCLGSTSSAGTPQCHCTAVAAGSFDITINNLHASAALDNTLTIHFAVIKGASS